MQCKKTILLVFFLGLLSLSTLNSVYAQTGPLDEEVNVTLTVADEEDPSTPILIAPSNGSVITDSTPSFVWEESTDNFSISHYVLYVDGSIKFDDIPITDTSNGDYTLTKSGDEYTLTPSASLSDGGHTWKITAVDINDNSKDSATWSFTIDTTAPSLVITGIGETTTSISAQDLSTLPNPYLTIYTNEPLIQGTSEANSTLQLTVDIPSEASLNYTISVDGSGNWSQTLPILTRDVKITLNFIVTDSAGNVTALSDVFFMVATEFFFSTPVPTPPPITPGETPFPTSTPTFSAIAIPIEPPKEVVSNILDSIFPPEIFQQIPESIQELAQDIADETAPIATILVSGVLPFTATALVASQFGWGISLQILLRILQALGILPPPSPQGMVFNSKTEEPVPFAILNITKIGDLSTQETVVTNTEGVYGGVQLPPGKYQISVRHQDFVFPSAIERPAYLSIFEFYKNEVFQVSDEKTKQLFLIPVDPLKGDVKKAKKFPWPLIRERLVRLSSYLLFPLFALSLLITIFYPTYVNIAVCVVYVGIVSFRVFKWFKKPIIHGKVVDNTGAPLANVFVRIFIQESNQLMSVLVTDKKGRFKAFLPKNEYQVSLSKQKYVWVENGEVQNFYLADARKSKVTVLAVMEDSQNMFKDLFA